MMEDMESVTREVFLDADPSEVWDAVTSPEQLEEWFGGQAQGEIAPGELVRFTTPDGAERRAVIERMDEPRELIFRWLPTADEPPSRVDITIDETDDGSILRVVERRFEAAVTPVPQIGFKALARAGV
jgi:uncharacterized protein YndB with AHSA1/START domain